MATLPDEIIVRIVNLRRDGLSTRAIGRELGIAKSTVGKYLKKYQPHGGIKGTPPPATPIDQFIDKTDIDGTVEILKHDRPASVEEMMKACGLDKRIWIPQYYKPNTWEGFYKIGKHGEGGHRKVKLIQSKCTFKRLITENLEDAILSFVKEHVPPLPKPKLGKVIKKKVKDGFMVSWGFWDAHIGSYGWNDEVGTDWDVDMACKRIYNSIDEMVHELSVYPIEKILMPIGNDFMHFDSVRHTTTYGEHFLDTDTRYAKVYLSGLKCLSYMIDRALEICDNIELLYVPGNHDVTSSFNMTVTLDQRYRNDPRVKADLSMNPRKYRLHGGTLLGFDHGSTAGAKPANLLLAFSTEALEHWSKSTYREIQIGDKHQRWEKSFEGVIPTNGVLIRRNPSLCNIDSWHHRKALVGEPMKSVEAWRYDRVGYRGSHVTWANDADHPKVKDEWRRE
jgi:hypothetical protein